MIFNDTHQRGPGANTTDVCVWPDGTWCRQDSIEEYQWKSDDYKVYHMDPGLTDEEIDNHLNFSW